MANAKYKKQADGYYQTKIWDGTYEDGKKHRVTIRSKKSSRDLENKINELKRKVEERKNVKSTDASFLEYARIWSDVYKQQRSNSTKAMYSNVIEKHLIAIANVRLQDIERIHLQMVISNASGKKRTQQQIILTFKQILRSAVADHLFPANVMEELFAHTESISYRPTEKRPLLNFEKQAVFKADLNLQDKVFLYIIYGCGLRRGEALALTRFDINLTRKELSVSRACEFVSGNHLIKEPKSHNGFRTVPIPDKIFPTLEAYVKSLKRSNLFVMRDGNPISKSSYDKMWRRILLTMQNASSEQIDGLTAHVFRHNYCTHLCYQIPQISIKRIAQLLGDTEKMVMEVYNHIILEKEDAVGAVENAMNF